MNNDYKQIQDTKKTIKRYMLTFVCTIPLLVVVALLLEGKVNRAVRMVIFVAILIVVLVIEEFIYAKIKSKKPENSQEKEDVFK